MPTHPPGRFTSSRARALYAALALVAALVLTLWTRPRNPSGEARREPPGRVERLLTPAPVPVPAENIAAAERLIERQLKREAFPGAVLVVGNRELIQSASAFGRTIWGEDAPATDADSTLYDLASLTKVVATTAAVMALVEDGKLELDAPVQRYVPEFQGKGKSRVTVRHLLTHTAGTRAGAKKIEGGTPAAVRRFFLSLPLTLAPGEAVLYSDIGFIVLWVAAERAAGEPLDRYLQRRVWGPLGMSDTQVGVPLECARCAPTQYLNKRDEPYAGGSYDVLARRLGGVAGNAGTFSTGRDLARFAAMIANEGRLGNVRIYEKRTVREFTRPQPGAGTRALGWEVYCREGIVPDGRPCREVYAFGHTGYTGTSLWVDPASRTWVVLLTNRTYLPHAEVRMQKLRRRVFEAILNGPPD